MNRYFIGVDGGGTKAKGVLTDAHGVVFAEAVAGPANIATDLPQALSSLQQLQQQLFAMAGLPESALADTCAVFGLAGANLPSAAAAFEQWSHPYQQLQLTTDLQVACVGAHRGDDGGIVICGTGTAGYAFCHGESLLVSAQGFPLGDKGAGAWLGWQAVRHTLDVLDGLITPTELSDAVALQLFQRRTIDATALIALCRTYSPTEYARLAPLVLQHAAKVSAALAMVHEGVAYLQGLLTRLEGFGAKRIAMVGGLVEPLRPYFSEYWQQQLTDVALAPEKGAVLLAQQLVQPRPTV